MDIFANVPPLFEPGTDLYGVMAPADAMEWRYEEITRYNPGVSRACVLLRRALNILGNVQ